MARRMEHGLDVHERPLETVMFKPIFITPDFAVSGALDAADIAGLATAGFRSVLNNRPDGEEPGQVTAAAEGRLVRAAGLAYGHVPASKLDLLSAKVADAQLKALRKLDGPVLAHCKSGQRSAMLWAAARMRERAGVDQVLSVLRDAGFELGMFREELEELTPGPARRRAGARRADTSK